jgi:hypothetical protein
VALIAPTLPLAVTLRRLWVSLPVLLLVAGMRVTPLFAALTNDLGIEGIRANLFVVIIAKALPLAGDLATDGLLGMKGRRLEESLAITATAITHWLGLRIRMQAAHSVENPAETEVTEKNRRV